MRIINSKRELFVDDWLIESMQNTALKLHSPLPKEVALDTSWCYNYVTVFKDDDRYRMYYRNQNDLLFVDGEGGVVPVKLAKDEYTERVKNTPELTAYAESRDGISWVEPELGIVEFEGSKANNYIWDAEGANRGTTHNFTPFKDTNPNCLPDQKYKAVAGTKRHNAGLIPFSSPDGIRWSKMQDKPVITDGAFDSQNLAFWDELRGQYVAFVRDFGGGIRTIRRCTSQDFINWSVPEWVEYHGASDEHLYTNAVTPYFRAPHIYLSFPRRFVPDRKALEQSPYDGISDQVFMTSRDGLHWDRRFGEAFIRQGPEWQNWTDRSGTIAYGVVPTGDHEISIYWTEHRKTPTCRVRRGTLRTDGFVSVNAPYTGGGFLTKPFRFSGNKLYLNYSTSAVGSVQVEVQDSEGHPIEGYELCAPVYGDEVDGMISWASGSDLAKLSEAPVRLRFVMKDADVYALQFRD